MARLVLCLLTSMSVVFAITPLTDPPVSAPTTRPAATRVVRPPSIDGLSTGRPTDLTGAVFFEVRDGGTADLLPNGKIHIVEPCLAPGAEEKPNVLWYCMQSTGTCAVCVFAPYVTPPLPQGSFPAGFPNPNQASGNQLPTISRHWGTSDTDSAPVYYVWMPQGATLGRQTDIFANPLGCGAGAGMAVGTYTYGEFMWDAAFTMARYGAVFNTVGHPALPNVGDPIIANATLHGHRCLPMNPVVLPAPALPMTIGNPNTSMFGIFGGISSPGGIPVAGGPGPATSWQCHINTGNYVWPGNFAVGNSLTWKSANLGGTGPTGDGINELMFLPMCGSPFLGLCSMIMDPTTGTIQECDIIWNATPNLGFKWPDRALTAAACPSAYPANTAANVNTATTNICQTGGPGWTTAIPHEIGHFFGLDHTNLHSGKFPVMAGPQYNAAGAGWSPCAAQPAAVGLPVVGLPAVAFPQTQATVAGWLDVPDMVGNYSAPGAWRCDPRIPSHADEASAMAEIYPVTAVGAVPANLPIAGATLGNLRPAINDSARIEGRAQAMVNGSNTPLFGVNIVAGPRLNTPFAPLNVPPLVGKLSGTGRITPGFGVVGKVDTSGAPQIAVTSGEFVIPGVPTIAPGGPVNGTIGQQYVLFAESVGCVNINPAPFGFAFNWAEWFYDFNYNNHWNTPIYGVLGGNQFALFSNGIINLAFCSYIPGLTGGVPGGVSLGSLYVVPGTVLQVTLDLSVGGQFFDLVSRPVVLIAPRTGYTAPGGLITATVIHDYALNVNSCTWSVAGGGTFVARNVSTVPIATNEAPGIRGPFTTTFTTTFGKIGITGGGSTLRFSAQEVGIGAAGGPPIQPVFGINEVGF